MIKSAFEFTGKAMAGTVVGLMGLSGLRMIADKTGTDKDNRILDRLMQE